MRKEILDKISVVKASEMMICGICLENVMIGEEVKELPNCRHQFHVLCIDD